jgi:hypothetical protein
MRRAVTHALSAVNDAPQPTRPTLVPSRFVLSSYASFWLAFGNPMVGGLRV